MNERTCRATQRDLNFLSLRNACVVRYECLDFLRIETPPARICGIHVYFPTPSPQLDGLTTRLLDSVFEQEAYRVLMREGTIRIVTDDRHYFEQCLRVFRNSRWKRVDWSTPIEPEGVVATSCEWIYRALGSEIYYCEFVKVQIDHSTEIVNDSTTIQIESTATALDEKPEDNTTP